MDDKRWNIFLSLQGNDENTPAPNKKIMRPIEHTENMLLASEAFDYFTIPEYKKIIIEGAGDGGEVACFLKRNYQAIGTTWHHGDKKFAKENYGIDLIVEDIHYMKSIPSGSFDGVFSFHVLEHSLAPIIAIFEMRRILRMGGKLLCLVPSPGSDLESGIQHYSVLRKELWSHLLNIMGFDNISVDIDSGNNIMMKAVKGNRECPGLYFENRINRSIATETYLKNDKDDKYTDKYLESYIQDTYLKILKRDVESDCVKACIQAIKQGDIQKDQLPSILRNSKEYKNRFQTDIEIIGIVTCGTYPSWIDYTIASFYNHVDKIVVVNGGYDIDHPEKGATIPLEREHKLIKEIDINNKIIEINPTQEMINNVYIICNSKFDCATHMTLATQIAHNLSNPRNKKRYILKLDSDQVMTQIIRKQMIDTIKNRLSSNKIGIISLQRSDNWHDLEHVGYDIVLGNGALLYESLPNQSYNRDGITGFRNNLVFNNMFETAHMKRISPKDIEPLEYHYKREWCRIYGENLAMDIKTGKKLTNEEIKEIAHREAVTFLEDRGRLMRSLPYDDKMLYHPPIIFQFISPLNYIKTGY